MVDKGFKPQVSRISLIWKFVGSPPLPPTKLYFFTLLGSCLNYGSHGANLFPHPIEPGLISLYYAETLGEQVLQGNAFKKLNSFISYIF